jgi:hypothetical protein
MSFLKPTFRVKTSDFNTSNLNDLAASLLIAINNLTGGANINNLNTINSNITNLNVTNITGSISNFSTSLTTNQLSATNFKQTYAPIKLSTGVNGGTGSFYYFGDSIVLGQQAPNLSNQRWSTLISNQYGVNQINAAVGGSTWSDCAITLYNLYTGGNLGNTTFFGYGYNDRANGLAGINEVIANSEAMALFTTLPISKIVNARNATKVGTWINNQGYTNIGVYSTVTGSTLTTTVNGRYVGFCNTLTTFTNTGSYTLLGVNVDGNAINVACPIPRCQPSNGQHGQQNYLWFYDTITGINQNHTISINYTGTFNFNGTGVFVDWFFGFDNNQTGCTSTIITPAQWNDYTWSSPTIQGLQQYPVGTETYRQTVNYGTKMISRKYRSRFGLPIYYVDESGFYSFFGQLLDDVTHANSSGHYYIYQTVNNVLQNGMINYLDS